MGYDHPANTERKVVFQKRLISKSVYWKVVKYSTSDAFFSNGTTYKLERH